MNQLQYLHKCSVIVSTAAGDGLDVSALRCTFKLKKTFVQTPNTAQIRIYNLAPNTENQIKKEFSRIVMLAGYESNYGLIYDGNIKQVLAGKENGTDTFVDIAAGDGDHAYAYATISKTIAAGASPRDILSAAADAMKPHGVKAGSIPVSVPGTALPRAKVMYGAARDMLRQAASSAGAFWSIQDGTVQVVGPEQLLPGQALVFSPQTGLIGSPVMTNEGISFKVLLNPLLKVAGPVILEKTKYDGAYKVLSIEYIGDTHGQDWYCNLIGKAL